MVRHASVQVGPYWTKNSGLNDRLLALYQDHLSCSLIAEQLEKEFPPFQFTRNAIIGRVHRLKLKERNPVQLVSKARPPRPKHHQPYGPVPMRPRPNRLVKAPPLQPDPPRHLTVLQLSHGDCKFPIGAHPFQTFCGCRALKGSPYCAFHYGRVYEQPKRVWS